MNLTIKSGTPPKDLHRNEIKSPVFTCGDATRRFVYIKAVDENDKDCVVCLNTELRELPFVTKGAGAFKQVRPASINIEVTEE